jgi:hypothetical protein
MPKRFARAARFSASVRASLCLRPMLKSGLGCSGAGAGAAGSVVDCSTALDSVEGCAAVVVVVVGASVVAGRVEGAVVGALGSGAGLSSSSQSISSSPAAVAR